ncbi:MAG TPA: hypothetical protein VNX68_15735 [Nitrosopumilaceae archaeon]|jgi:hypothetical protein|nr:hypothetical protein [Nitrosopumilaceae archaeon]
MKEPIKPYKITYMTDETKVTVFLHYGERMIFEQVSLKDGKQNRYSTKQLKEMIVLAAKLCVERYELILMQNKEVNLILEEIKNEERI